MIIMNLKFQFNQMIFESESTSVALMEVKKKTFN